MFGFRVKRDSTPTMETQMESQMDGGMEAAARVRFLGGRGWVPLSVCLPLSLSVLLVPLSMHLFQSSMKSSPTYGDESCCRLPWSSSKPSAEMLVLCRCLEVMLTCSLHRSLASGTLETGT